MLDIRTVKFLSLTVGLDQDIRASLIPAKVLSISLSDIGRGLPSDNLSKCSYISGIKVSKVFILDAPQI